MKKLFKVALGSIATLIVAIAKAEVSSASSVIYYQPELPSPKK